MAGAGAPSVCAAEARRHDRTGTGGARLRGTFGRRRASGRARSACAPVVLPFTREHVELSDPAIVWLLRAAQLLVGALAFVVAVNLAILLYARTVTRLGEIAVRTALGASRGRILSQLFIEALTLTVLGAVAGLAAPASVLQQDRGDGARERRVPVLDALRTVRRQRALRPRPGRHRRGDHGRAAGTEGHRQAAVRESAGTERTGGDASGIALDDADRRAGRRRRGRSCRRPLTSRGTSCERNSRGRPSPSSTSSSPT